jgi:hypothetical protein
MKILCMCTFNYCEIIYPAMYVHMYIVENRFFIICTSATEDNYIYRDSSTLQYMYVKI